MIFFIIKNNLFSRSFSRLLSSVVGTKKWLFTHLKKDMLTPFFFENSEQILKKGWTNSLIFFEKSFFEN